MTNGSDFIICQRIKAIIQNSYDKFIYKNPLLDGDFRLDTKDLRSDYNENTKIFTKKRISSNLSG